MVPIAIVAATLISYAAGWAIGVPVLLPILNTLASYPFMSSRSGAGIFVSRSRGCCSGR